MNLWCFVFLLAILSVTTLVHSTDSRSSRLTRSPQINFEGPLNGGPGRPGVGGGRPIGGRPGGGRPGGGRPGIGRPGIGRPGFG